MALETYYLSSQTSLSSFSQNIQNDEVNCGDIILVNHKEYGYDYVLENGQIITGVIPFEVVSKNTAELTDETDKKSITLMSKDIIRFCSFNVDAKIDDEKIDFLFNDNSWKNSTIRTYLNSDSPIVFSNLDQNILDKSKHQIDFYFDEPGFLYGFDEFIQDSIPFTNVTTATNDFNSSINNTNQNLKNNIIKQLSKLQKQYNYNNLILSVLQSSENRSVLTGIINDKITSSETKRDEYFNEINEINDIQEYVNSSGISKLDEIVNDFKLDVSNDFSSIISNFINIKKFIENPNHEDYWEKIYPSLLHIFSFPLNNIYFKIYALNDLLKSLSFEINYNNSLNKYVSGNAMNLYGSNGFGRIKVDGFPDIENTYMNINWSDLNGYYEVQNQDAESKIEYIYKHTEKDFYILNDFCVKDDVEKIGHWRFENNQNRNGHEINTLCYNTSIMNKNDLNSLITLYLSDNIWYSEKTDQTFNNISITFADDRYNLDLSNIKTTNLDTIFPILNPNKVYSINKNKIDESLIYCLDTFFNNMSQISNKINNTSKGGNNYGYLINILQFFDIFEFNQNISGYFDNFKNMSFLNNNTLENSEFKVVLTNIINLFLCKNYSKYTSGLINFNYSYNDEISGNNDLLSTNFNTKFNFSDIYESFSYILKLEEMFNGIRNDLKMYHDYCKKYYYTNDKGNYNYVTRLKRINYAINNGSLIKNFIQSLITKVKNKIIDKRSDLYTFKNISQFREYIDFDEIYRIYGFNKSFNSKDEAVENIIFDHINSIYLNENKNSDRNDFDILYFFDTKFSFIKFLMAMMSNSAILKPFYKLLFDKFKIFRNKLKNIRDILDSYDENSNQFKLLLYHLKYLGISKNFNFNQLLNELNELNLEDRSNQQIISTINDFKSFINHLYSFYDVHIQMFDLINVNKEESIMFIISKISMLFVVAPDFLYAFNNINYQHSYYNNFKQFFNIDKKEYLNIITLLMKYLINDLFLKIKDTFNNKECDIYFNTIELSKDLYENSINFTNVDNVYNSFKNHLIKYKSNLEKIKNSLEIKYQKEIDKIFELQSEITKFEKYQNYNISNNITDTEILISSNLFINEVLNGKPMSRIKHSAKSNKGGRVSSFIDDDIYKPSFLSIDNNLYFYPVNKDEIKIIKFNLKQKSAVPSSIIIDTTFDIKNYSILSANYLSSFIPDEAITGYISGYPVGSGTFISGFLINIENSPDMVSSYLLYNEYILKFMEPLSTEIKKFEDSFHDNFITQSVDKLFLPSLTELGFGYNDEIKEGTEFILNKSNSSLKKNKCNEKYLTRSPNVNNKFELFYINENGNLDYTATKYYKNGLVICFNLI